MGSSKNGTWPKVSNQNRVSVSVLLRTVSARNLHSPKCLRRQISLWENVFWIPPSEVMLMRFRRHLTRGGLPFSLPPLFITALGPSPEFPYFKIYNMNKFSQNSKYYFSKHAFVLIMLLPVITL